VGRFNRSVDFLQAAALDDGFHLAGGGILDRKRSVWAFEDQRKVESSGLESLAAEGITPSWDFSGS
jgi:hypothetical protein